ncbi:hypothetical protein BHE74_00027468 [Ensete ventricosum]|nr:hypothetical protein GW17_00016452 [Ensete ventricosum]RWW65235.1 hypothetical protein BHE74_00027468 [Ensete ventricosum]
MQAIALLPPPLNQQATPLSQSRSIPQLPLAPVPVGIPPPDAMPASQDRPRPTQLLAEYPAPQPWTSMHRHTTGLLCPNLKPSQRTQRMTHEDPTTAYGPMLRRDAGRVLAILRAKFDRSHLGLILMHSEHPGRANHEKLLSPIARGL